MPYEKNKKDIIEKSKGYPKRKRMRLGTSEN